MLLQANEVQYDYTNKRVSAVGNVQVYHQGSTLEADRLIYDENTQRLRAEGNVRMTEPDGRITYADVMDLSDDFRDGFVDSLRLDTADATRMAAARADRSAGTFTVFHSGVYTACEPCKDDPKKPPTWQVKAARMIHDGTEKMIYFEDARLEFFGKPVAYMPLLLRARSHGEAQIRLPDSRSLSYSSIYGVGVDIPYYWALAPDYDLTFTPRLMTQAGRAAERRMAAAADRRRLLDPRHRPLSARQGASFCATTTSPTPGYRDFRGALETTGQFALTDRWVWGWDGILPTDKTFFQDYHLRTYQRGVNVLQTGFTEGVSQLYLTGRGDRSYFDIRTIYYYGFSEADVQGQIPVIHPVIDYSYIFDNPVLGGELGYRTNLTSLSRDKAAFDPITSDRIQQQPCALTTADPDAEDPGKLPAARLPGDLYARLGRSELEAQHHRPVRPDLHAVRRACAPMPASPRSPDQPGVSNYFTPGDTTDIRAMPTVGLEYRYPFINVQSWGTQTIEPIAQIIVRPNETEHRQAAERGLAKPDLRRHQPVPGRQVRRLGPHRRRRPRQRRRAIHRAVQPRRLRQRAVRPVLPAVRHQLVRGRRHRQHRPRQRPRHLRVRLRGAAVVPARPHLLRSPPASASIKRRSRCGASRSRRARQLRPLVRRAAVRQLRCPAAARLPGPARRHPRQQLAQDQAELGGYRSGPLRHRRDKFDQTQFGVGYIDDCLILALNYITSYTYSGIATRDQRVMLQLSLRTLGGTAFSQTVSSGPTGL